MKKINKKINKKKENFANHQKQNENKNKK